MVWFQCEDCGENLKKPKLPNHFRICSATKLSCIDCGEMFGQQSVQGHTQCITEAEKYGPKGQGKPQNGANPKSNKDSKQKPDVDINVGLSTRPPWFCSLCNTKATSQQTLLLHADGKKHRAKARAFHAANQPKQTEESAPETNGALESPMKNELSDSKDAKEQEMLDGPTADGAGANSASENEKLPSKRKRKLDAEADDGNGKLTGDDNATGNGTIEVENVKAEKTESESKKSKTDATTDCKVEPGNRKEDKRLKIKWKKIVKSALLTNEGSMKMKKLRKRVRKSIIESYQVEDDVQLDTLIEQKINSIPAFRVDGKYVHLKAKNED
ncbi:hypothetical protein Tsubulata_003254 [Turnera subulata]|uniref:U1-type domain-containing protein n=1 Tax=Turnera subulata TaxID=218843 RepID=A0A9Q0GIW1_9ROSI|nr:hypothetical protein Tsubulata_003254 [Turnera subulata]